MSKAKADGIVGLLVLRVLKQGLPGVSVGQDCRFILVLKTNYNSIKLKRMFKVRWYDVFARNKFLTVYSGIAVTRLQPQKKQFDLRPWVPFLARRWTGWDRGRYESKRRHQLGPWPLQLRTLPSSVVSKWMGLSWILDWFRTFSIFGKDKYWGNWVIFWSLST